MLTSYFRHYAETYSAYKSGPICYEDGCLYRGLITLYEATGEQNWLDTLIAFAQKQVAPDGSMTGYELEEYNIDNILSGRAFLYLYKNTKDERYLKACQTLAKQLESHPKTDGGNYWHKKRYPYQVWLDGLYMGLPFQIEYGQMTGDEALIDNAISQLSHALEIMGVGQNGLYAHGYDESRAQSWADKETGLSPAHWSRAIGWLTVALVDICDLVGKEKMGPVFERSVDLLGEIVKLQREQGAWLQVIDQPDLEGNYLESSATAMFSYALLKGARLGLGAEFVAPGLKGHAYLEQLVADSDPQLLPNIVCVAGLGGFDGNYRDGTAEYYVTETIRADDVKGVGPFMMASAEKLLLEK
ncbi:unsaturated rhamnogalacturonyl hydrolase [Cohaesibacter marisflavi]|uniref:Unsaturated rhamnogalacturonyl hydrolase n=1 Tax=Cohaesibacter marisflavi TaxID=655353 RepID=A0A1I4ZRK7_9HYPH|nr:glycoside hydrolase family 88 protein [Cohaesibacter marisflavi]SFN52683.1 unsaturated rhamnogalacturonyl hydrolase [Cohaesibacter marisflavi]